MHSGTQPGGRRTPSVRQAVRPKATRFRGRDLLCRWPFPGRTQAHTPGTRTGGCIMLRGRAAFPAWQAVFNKRCKAVRTGGRILQMILHILASLESHTHDFEVRSAHCPCRERRECRRLPMWLHLSPDALPQRKRRSKRRGRIETEVITCHRAAVIIDHGCQPWSSASRHCSCAPSHTTHRTLLEDPYTL